VIYGQPKGGGGWQQQAFRYNTDTWGTAEARAHCSSHDGRFEAAQPQTQRLTVETSLTVAPTRLTVNTREYLAAPAVLIVCGVLNQGLITEDELDPEAWEGAIVTVNHPSDAQGRAVSARAPGVAAHYAVGHVTNATLGLGARQGQEVASLCAELWLDIELMKALGGDALQALQKIETATPMDVSTGFYSVAEQMSGMAYGADYDHIHRNIRPDHLALLPNGAGACSWSAEGGGCGVPRFHERACTCGGTCTACQGDLPMDVPSPTRLHALWTMLSRFFAPDAIHPASLVTEQAQCPHCGAFLPEAETGDEVTCPQCGKVVTMADVRHAEPDGPEEEPAEVPEPEADEETENPASPDTEENAMPTDSIKRRVDALIANERSGWTEADRAELEQCSEVHLLRLEHQPKEQPSRKAQTAEEVITEMYAEPSVQQTFRAMYKDYQTRKTRAIEVLLALPKRPQSLTEDRMQAMDADDLEEYLQMAGADVPLRPGVPGVRDYSGRGGPARRETPEDEQVPAPPKTFSLVVEHQRKLGLIP